MGSVSSRIFTKIQRVPANIIEGFKGVASSNVGDVMGRSNVMNHEIKTVNLPGVHLVGSAFTVRTHASDNLVVHKAMDLAQPGDVIVIDASGDMEHAILGEIMSYYARKRGIAGFIVDGAVRDILSLRQMGFPVFAKGCTPRGPLKEGPGEINTTISCGNVPVSPGDVIIGDSDGVVVVPRSDAATILDRVKALEEKEKKTIALIDEDKWNRDWVDDALQAKGIEIIE